MRILRKETLGSDCPKEGASGDLRVRAGYGRSAPGNRPQPARTSNTCGLWTVRTRKASAASTYFEYVRVMDGILPQSVRNPHGPDTFPRHHCHGTIVMTLSPGTFVSNPPADGAGAGGGGHATLVHGTFSVRSKGVP